MGRLATAVAFGSDGAIVEARGATLSTTRCVYSSGTVR
jgi:hypothetical protein